jgi:hypothetical protein
VIDEEPSPCRNTRGRIDESLPARSSTATW